MADHIRIKNIKLNINNANDKLILDYFDNNKDNFSKVTKSLLLDYIAGNKSVASKSVIGLLEKNTELLAKLVENGLRVDNSLSNDLNIELNGKKVIREEGKETEKIEKDNDEITVDNDNEENDFNIDFLSQLQN